MKLLHTIETIPNPTAICALSSSLKKCYIAYPRPTNSSASSFSPHSHTPPGVNAPPTASGDVILFGAIKLEAADVIEVHKALLVILSLNSEGSLLATSSDKGTIIRAFFYSRFPETLGSFRRGRYPSRIFTISSKLISTVLCGSSATETVHTLRRDGLNPQESLSRSFRATDLDAGGPLTGSLTSPPNQAGAAGGGFDHYVVSKRRSGSGMFGSIVGRSSQKIGRTIAGAAGGYLPHDVTEMLESARDFAFAKLPNAGLKSVVALSSTSPHTIVVTNDGCFIAHDADVERGGECMLTKQYSLTLIWLTTSRAGICLLDSSKKMGQSLMYD
ncbi:unnamed protein product, partial [Tuber aestivum]